MSLRKSILVLPVVVLFGCADRSELTGPSAPDGATQATSQSTTFVVTNLLDGPEPGPQGSLRAAISSADNGHNIAFDPSLAGGTITLVAGELVINKSLTIVGPDGGITISGANNFRVLRIGNVFQVVLENLTLRDGTGLSGAFADRGGAILIVDGNLIIRNSTISNNWAERFGAGIMQIRGTLTLSNSTISDNGLNSALGLTTQFGGGLYVARGNAEIVNSTISGNTAEFRGGGIVNDQASLNLVHSTVANNGAAVGGGILNFGVVDFPASTALLNSIVAHNFSATEANGPDIRNLSLDSADPHAFVNLTGSHSLVGTTFGHTLTAVGNNFVGVDARFELDGFGKAKLANNGGSTQTHALLGDSPAIDAAGSAACTAAPVNGRDQRGVGRPQGVACDMGSFELVGVPAPPPTVAALAINASGTVDKNSGVAYVTGTMTCSTPGVVNLRVRVMQEQKQRRLSVEVVGVNTINVQCAGPTAWAAAVKSGNGVFVNSDAHVGASTQNVVPAAQVERMIKLFWTK
jgi:hypothetical protein